MTEESTRPEPRITQPSPFEVTVEPGQRLFWCACGRTKNGAFCDGSHKGTGITPLVTVAEEGGTKYLCGCKRTKTPPWCDGSHAAL